MGMSIEAELKNAEARAELSLLVKRRFRAASQRAGVLAAKANAQGSAAICRQASELLAASSTRAPKLTFWIRQALNHSIV